MILCIDTAVDYCGVGLLTNGQMADASRSETAMRASEVLHGMIRELLDRNDLSIKNLQCIAVNGGPGSYTGLRIGASTAKGLCYALEIPLIHVSSMELMVHGAVYQEKMTGFDHYIPLIDARRDEVFTAVYNSELELLLEPQPLVLDEGSFEEFRTSKNLFFGNGAKKAEKILNKNSGETFISYDTKPNDFETIIWERWNNKIFADPIHYAPQYLKNFHFTKPKKAL